MGITEQIIEVKQVDIYCASGGGNPIGTITEVTLKIN